MARKGKLEIVGGIFMLAVAVVLWRLMWIFSDKGELTPVGLCFFASSGMAFLAAFACFGDGCTKLARVRRRRANAAYSRHVQDEHRRRWRRILGGGMNAVILALIAASLLLVVQPARALTESDLQTVGDRLGKADGRQIQTQIKDDPDLGSINAAAMKDGGIIVTPGMMEFATSRDELAGVIAHEVKHGDNHHHQRLSRKTKLWGTVGYIGAALLGAKQDTAELAGSVVGPGLVGGHASRVYEYEADKDAITLMFAAGYDPQGYVTMLGKLRTKFGSNSNAGNIGFGFLADHGPMDNRIAYAKKYVAEQSGKVQPQGQSLPSGPTAIVVVDPEAANSYGFAGFGTGFFDSDLSEIAKQETETVLEKQGYQVLVSTQDNGPLQDEIELENSEWGQHGENRQPKGYFSGVQFVFYASAYMVRGQNLEVGDWRYQARVEGLKVGVRLRQIETATRKQVKTFQGTGSKPALTSLRLPLGRGWSSGEITLEQIENLGREAVDKAVTDALKSIKVYSKPVVKTSSTLEEFGTPPPAICFVGVGAEVVVGSEPITLEVRVPKETVKVLFAVYNGEGTKQFEGESHEQPFRVRVRPETLEGLAVPICLEAVAYDRDGKIIGSTQVLLKKR